MTSLGLRPGRFNHPDPQRELLSTLMRGLGKSNQFQFQRSRRPNAVSVAEVIVMGTLLCPPMVITRRRSKRRLTHRLVCASHRRIPAIDRRCEPGIWARRSADGRSGNFYQ